MGRSHKSHVLCLIVFDWSGDWWEKVSAQWVGQGGAVLLAWFAGLKDLFSLSYTNPVPPTSIFAIRK